MKQKSKYCGLWMYFQPNSTGEQKTKPTQNSVRELRGLGLSPDLVRLYSLLYTVKSQSMSRHSSSEKYFFLLQIVCRCSTPLETAVKEKISMFCHVEPEQVICVHDVSSIYRVPLLLEDQGIVEYLCRRLDLPIEMRPRKMLTKWKEISDRFVLFPSTLTVPKTAICWQFQGCCSCFEWPVFVLRSDRLLEQTSIALVGKYTKLSDSYASVIKALEHSALAINYKLEVKVRNDGATSSNFLYFYDVGDSFVLINFS